MLEAIKYIDKVVYFDVESELRAQILLNNAKTIVVGKEYKDKGVIGAEMVDEVVFFDRLGDYSTTNILESK
jgi:bifunctional ADP-heptose synthase (sugar kinase/adenylyltransferase)